MLGAGLGKSEEGIATITPAIAACSGADLTAGDLAADVIFGAVGVLTIVARHGLEALAGSRKSEARMRDRARIVLSAASGIGSRAIARDIYGTPGHRLEVASPLCERPLGGLE